MRHWFKRKSTKDEEQKRQLSRKMTMMQYEYNLGDTLAQAHRANWKRKEGIRPGDCVELDEIGKADNIPLAAYAIKDKVIGLRTQTLDGDFAGRVLKLEMQFEKGIDHVSLDDVDNLMNLYMEAV